MVYIHSFNTNKNSVSEAMKRAKNAEQWAARAKRESEAPSRAMQMVPTFLALAEYKGKDRFNSAEIERLSGMIKKYSSEIPADNLVKQLLNIGIEKGEPLSAKEIEDFLLTTAFMDKNGQDRVMRFMKTLKEHDTLKYDAEYIKNNNTWEQLKKEVAEGKHKYLEGLSEKELRKYYDNFIKEEVQAIRYKAYTSQFDIDPQVTSKYINQNNQGFVYGVAECEKPEILAEIVLKTGAVPEVASSPNELVQVYELSNGNLGLIQDLVIGFYPNETKEIVSKLAAGEGSCNLSEYYQEIPPSEYYQPDVRPMNLSIHRSSIIHTLGLADKVFLVPIESYGRIKTVDGSFEQGKRR